ncbi:hypothetical protein HIM_04098 [Hirsutella minnesotensis 3608]|uniref:Aminoglycoside phosphotransferase domain-containing protein n=1 Tax=Hirsutella minnesotensis 3608 TaxID=1043627 RepID=A0A0F8A631_9HYPO|nr:hypothetical protein HIM_04098 [Hirsutella minnesotensis 3608]
MNSEGFERRHAVVHGILRQYGLQCDEVIPVAYDERCPFPFNNFIYRVVLSSPATAANFTKAGPQPCTQPPATAGVLTLIVRLSNTRAEGLNNSNRVENEVAALHLARNAVAKFDNDLSEIIPAVYAWKASDSQCLDESGFGWIVMECMAGVDLDTQFDGLSQEDKHRVIGSAAKIFAAIQSVKLPPGVNSHGGLTIDEAGKIVSGQATLQEQPDGPWASYEALWLAQFHEKLREADRSGSIKGWHENGVRQRIDLFINAKLCQTIHDHVDTAGLSLIHTDFTMNNMLFDPESKRITALLDFDWAAVTHPAHEFFTSFHDFKGTTRLLDSVSLQRAVLTSDFRRHHDDGEVDEAWELAAAWDEALRQNGAMRPSDIRGINTLENLRHLADLIAPFHLTNPVMVKRLTDEQLGDARAKNERALLEALEALGT